MSEETKVCKVCKHSYIEPCDGKNPNCLNLRHVNEMKKRAKTEKKGKK